MCFKIQMMWGEERATTWSKKRDFRNDFSLLPLKDNQSHGQHFLSTQQVSEVGKGKFLLLL